MDFKRVTVLGCGALGTAWAHVLASKGLDVHLWARRDDQAKNVQRNRKNEEYLSGIELAPNLDITADISCVEKADIVILAIPAQQNRQVLKDIAERIRVGTPLVLCAKGLEQKTLALMSDIATALAAHLPVFVLSGPGFAEDIAMNKPVALVLAGVCDAALHSALQHTLATPFLRIYAVNDLIGTQIGGALKNVYAIACGAVAGFSLGNSAQAALMTRGFAEMLSIATKMGGQVKALVGLAGVGDLTLTCQSFKSRNYALGFSLAADAVGERAPPMVRGVCEGKATVDAAVLLVKNLEVEAPICRITQEFLAGRTNIASAVSELMERPLIWEY
jgi:glycerol-3-phosphate dehydrogenase (NAD(P)+)